MRSIALAAALALAAPAALAQTPTAAPGRSDTAAARPPASAPQPATATTNVAPQGLPATTVAPAPAKGTEAATPSVAKPPTASAPAAASPATTDDHVRAEFLKQHLAFDRASGEVVEGSARKQLEPTAFYRMIGRPDLVAKSEAASRRRLYLAIAGGAVAAAGITFGAIELATAPDLDSLECVNQPTDFNDRCVPEGERHHTIGTLAIVGGAAIGALLGTIAYWTSPQVLTPDQAQSLIAQHNAQVMKRLRAEAPSVRVIPEIGPQGGGLVASLRF